MILKAWLIHQRANENKGKDVKLFNNIQSGSTGKGVTSLLDY